MFRTVACCPLVMFCVAFAIGQTMHPDLSGTWQIDVARSTEDIAPLPSDPDTRPPPPPPGMAWKAFSPEILTHREPELRIPLTYERHAVLHLQDLGAPDSETARQVAGPLGGVRSFLHRKMSRPTPSLTSRDPIGLKSGRSEPS